MRSWRTAVGIAVAALVVAGSALGLHVAGSKCATPAAPSRPLPANPAPSAKLTTVAEFPVGSFLENVAVRADGSMLVTELKKKQLWYIPTPISDAPVQPQLLYTFDQPPFDLVEAERDVFYVDTSSYLTRRASYLQRVDLRHWEPGLLAPVQTVLRFPFPVSTVNGSCLLAPNVLLVADSLLGLIWRVDLSTAERLERRECGSRTGA